MSRGFFDLFSDREPQTFSKPKASAMDETEASSKADAATNAAGGVAETAVTGAAARMFRLPVRLFRWSQVARFAAYAGAGAAVTWTAEKLLDYAHKESPDSISIAKADFVARKAWSAEKFLFHAGLSVAGTAAGAAYDVIPQQPQSRDSVSVSAAKQIAPVETPQPAVRLDEPDAANDQGQTRILAAVPPVPTKPHRSPVANLRDANIPDPETERLNRQELARHAKPTAELAPDGMPASGCYEPATGVNWGAYMKGSVPVATSPTPIIETDIIPLCEAAIPVPIEPAYMVVPEGREQPKHEREAYGRSHMPRFRVPTFGPVRHH
jgi:hypothetical protein